MSIARPTHRGASYRLALRCVGRKFMLNPAPEVTQAIGYSLGIALERYGVALHAVSAMSNHFHGDVSDPNGCISEFRRDFKSLCARALNCHYGRWEYFWAPEDGQQEVSSRQAAAKGMSYTITNPISAGLVASPEAWPGLTTCVTDLGAIEDECRSFTFEKPNFFFRHEEDSGLPESVTFSLVPHPLGADDPEKFVADVRAEVDTIIECKRAEVRKAGGRFKGRDAVLAHNWWDCPKTTAERRQLNPRFAEPDPERRIRRLLSYKDWLREYADSLAQWQETGEAEFPPGTNKMKTYPGVTGRAGPSPA